MCLCVCVLSFAYFMYFLVDRFMGWFRSSFGSILVRSPLVSVLILFLITLLMMMNRETHLFYVAWVPLLGVWKGVPDVLVLLGAWELV